MLNPSELKKIDAYWRASNYLAEASCTCSITPCCAVR